MSVARADFRMPRGGVPFLAVRLHGRDPRTQEVRRLPIPGVTIEWAIDWPDEEPEVRTQFSGAPLKIDPRSGFVMFPIERARVEALQVAARPVDTRIRLLMADGTPVPFLTGTISLEC
jgi:hypothetical protein